MIKVYSQNITNYLTYLMTTNYLRANMNFRSYKYIYFYVKLLLLAKFKRLFT